MGVLVCFMQSIWGSVYKDANSGTLSVKEANKYVAQIEAMLAEKTRQKIKGSDNEEGTLLKAFKHFDSKALEFVSYAEFVRTLESFGVLSPLHPTVVCQVLMSSIRLFNFTAFLATSLHE